MSAAEGTPKFYPYRAPEMDVSEMVAKFGAPTERATRLFIADVAAQLGQARTCFDQMELERGFDLVDDAQKRLLVHQDRMGLPEPMAGKPRVTVTRLVSAVAFVVACFLVAALALAGGAKASEVETVASAAVVAVVVDSQAETFRTTVYAPGIVNGHHGASVWVGYPGEATFALAGAGVSRSPYVTVTGRLDTTRITSWGQVDAYTMDDATGVTRLLTLDVRRKTVINRPQVELRSGGVAVGTRVSHYSPTAGGYVSSNLSPLRLQEYRSGAWVTLKTVTSNRFGMAGAVVAAAPGPHYFRMVRPSGATVWGATSGARGVTVPGC